MKKALALLFGALFILCFSQHATAQSANTGGGKIQKTGSIVIVKATLALENGDYVGINEAIPGTRVLITNAHGWIMAGKVSLGDEVDLMLLPTCSGGSGVGDICDNDESPSAVLFE